MEEKAKISKPVVRDAAWVDREYGRDKWPLILKKINDLTAAGEHSLSRVISSLRRSELNFPLTESIAAVTFGNRAQLPAAVAWHGLYALVAESVIAACRQETDAIIDLGCGWGQSLFEIWLRGGPRLANYYAMEFTEAGLDCVKTLSALDPELRIRPLRFDFQNPDFSTLSHPIRHAVIVTLSSAHQVPVVNRQAYEKIMNVAQAIDCLHFEQIGWQIKPEEARVADREYALANDYNRNLWEVLTALRDDRQIEMLGVYPDLIGTQALYPLSFVHWRRIRN